MKRLWVCTAPFVFAASCSGTTSTSDGGTDAATDVAFPKCFTAADCPQGWECAFPMSDGCAATRKCFPPAPECKKAVASCSCSLHQTISGDCNDAFQQPVTGAPCATSCTGLSCETCDTSSFVAQPQSKPSVTTNACSQQDIASFVTACVGASSTQSTCDAWKQSDAGVGCSTCIMTATTAKAWGPLVCGQGSCMLNAGGCVDILSGQVADENGTDGSCGDFTNVAAECVIYACSACMPDGGVCEQNAEQNECQSYFTAAVVAAPCASVDAGTSVCSPKTDADYAAFINVFCGTGP